jgi:hypothetical protein
VPCTTFQRMQYNLRCLHWFWSGWSCASASHAEQTTTPSVQRTLGSKPSVASKGISVGSPDTLLRHLPQVLVMRACAALVLMLGHPCHAGTCVLRRASGDWGGCTASYSVCPVDQASGSMLLLLSISLCLSQAWMQEPWRHQRCIAEATLTQGPEVP